jgi:hypothetical protein
VPGGVGGVVNDTVRKLMSITLDFEVTLLKYFPHNELEIQILS